MQEGELIDDRTVLYHLLLILAVPYFLHHLLYQWTTVELQSSLPAAVGWVPGHPYKQELVESSWPEQSRVNKVWPVGGPHDEQVVVTTGTTATAAASTTADAVHLS